MLGILAPLLAGAVLMASPAQAQFSAGYKFLEAVKKKEGDKVEAALNEPGSTIVNTRDVTTGETALHIVTQRRDLTWMSYLLAKGANVNARDVRGVHAAAARLEPRLCRGDRAAGEEQGAGRRSQRRGRDAADLGRAPPATPR